VRLINSSEVEAARMADTRLAPPERGIYKFFAQDEPISTCSLFGFQPGIEFGRPEAPKLSDLCSHYFSIARHSLQGLGMNAQ
jgi:hypothetical protein